jgi:hypothetical protein
MRFVALFTLTSILARPAAVSQEAATPFEPTPSYEKRTVQGSTVLVSAKLADHPKERDEALALLEVKLKEVARLVPAGPLKHLKKIRFWLEWESKPNGAAEYHPSIDWLKEHGYNPEKAKNIEINNARNFVKWTNDNQPMMILHELAHSYHDLVLGFDKAEIEALYRRAVKSHLYDEVAYGKGGKRRAYALTDAKEYFAEISEAYFGRNDFYPFTREELRAHDPEAYAFLVKTWGAPTAPIAPTRSPEISERR